MKIFFFVLSLIWAAPSFALEAVCQHDGASYDGAGTTHGGKNNEHIGIYSQYPLNCTIVGKYGKQTQIKTTLTTVGPGISAFSESFYSLTCPTVSVKHLQKRLSKKGSWSVSGPYIEGGIPVGAGFGLLANHRGAVCILAAGDVYGVSILAGATTLTFSEISGVQNQ